MTNDVIIIGNDCEKCKYCTFVEGETAKELGVCCSARNNKFYHWGQCLPCDFREVIKNGTN